MMDRNLWATKSGTWCSATDTWACGDHFQRWNNYWFANPGVGEIDSIATSAVNWQTDASSYWPNNPYSSGTFYKWYSDWSSVRNDNLRWWAEDSEHNNRWYDIANNVAYTVTGRQWPCPDWYHIPSQWERWTILKRWSANWTWTTSNEITLNWTYPLQNFSNDTAINLSDPITTWLELVASWTPNTDSNNNWIADEEESFIITREDGDGNFVWSGEFAYGVSPAFGGTQPEKTGYIFSSRDPAVQSVTGDFTYTATWTANEYTITFDTDWWSAISPITAPYNAPVSAPANPTKAGAVFDSWSPAFPDTMPLGWATLKAIWRNALNNGWTAWWGWVKKEKDDCPNGDYSDSYYDGTCGSKDSSSNDDNLSSWANAKDIDSTEWLESNELQTAYERAYENWITTMDTVEKADLNGNLTRIAMAKMLSKYAINVLWKTPDETKINQFNDVDEKLDSEYDNGVSLAYQLWIMWINMPNNNFRPFDLVSRAEFVTALSRMKYGTPDGEDVYYSTHMRLLSNLWIVKVLDPEMLELRGYVMVMLMRSK